MPTIKIVDGVVYLIYNNEDEASRAHATSEVLRSVTTRFASFGALYNALELGNLIPFPEPFM